jgi:hypothetical protein
VDGVRVYPINPRFVLILLHFAGSDSSRREVFLSRSRLIKIINVFLVRFKHHGFTLIISVNGPFNISLNHLCLWFVRHAKSNRPSLLSFYNWHRRSLAWVWNWTVELLLVSIFIWSLFDFLLFFNWQLRLLLSFSFTPWWLRFHSGRSFSLWFGFFLLPRLPLFVVLHVVVHAIDFVLDVLVLKEYRFLALFSMAHHTLLFSLLTLTLLQLLVVVSIRNFFNHSIFGLLVHIVKSEYRVNPALIVVHWCFVGVRHVHYFSFRERRVFIYTSGIVCIRSGSISSIRSKSIFFLRLVLCIILPHFPPHDLLFFTRS